MGSSSSTLLKAAGIDVGIQWVLAAVAIALQTEKFYVRRRSDR